MIQAPNSPQPSYRSDIFGSGRVSEGPRSVRESKQPTNNPYSSRSQHEDHISSGKDQEYSDPDEEKDDCPLHLDYMIGYSGKYSNALKAHPTEADTFVKSIGSNLIISYYGETKTQRFIRGYHDEDITAIAISSTGKYLASGQLGSTHVKGYPSPVILYDFASGQPLIPLQGITQGITHLSFSPDERFLLAAGSDSTLYIWDLNNGLPSPINPSFHGGEVVMAKRYPTPLDVCFWGYLNNESDEEGGGGRHELNRKRRNDYALITGIGSDVNLNDFIFDPVKVQWSIRPNELAVPPGTTRFVSCGMMSSSTPFVFIGTKGGEVMVYRTDTRVFRTYVPVCSGGVSSIVPLSSRRSVGDGGKLDDEEEDGEKSLLVGGGDGIIRILKGHDLEWNTISEVQLDGPISSISLVSDGLEAVVGTARGNIYRVLCEDLTSFQLLETSHVTGINCITFLQDSKLSEEEGENAGDICLTGSEDGCIKLWDLSDYVSPVKFHERSSYGGVLSLDYIPSENLILSGWGDGTIRALDASTLSRVIWHIPDAHRDGVSAVTHHISSSIQFFATGGREGGVRVWGLHRRELMCQFTENKSMVSELLVDVRQPHLIHSSSKDGMVLTFDIQKERRTVAHILKGTSFHGMVQRCDSEQELVTGGGLRGEMISWDCDYQDPVAIYYDREGCEITSLSLDPTSNLMSFATTNKKIHLMQLPMSSSSDQTPDLGGEVVEGKEGHCGNIQMVRISPNHSSILSVDSDGCICCWKVGNLS